MYRNPKDIKQEIKLWMFYLLDLGIVAGAVMLSVYTAKLLPISAIMKMFFYLTAFIFGVWLCVRTPAHPKERNLQIIYHMFTRDRNRYHEIQFNRNERGRVKL